MLRFSNDSIDKKNLDLAIQQAAKLKKIAVSEFSGWVEFVRLLDGYANALLEYKKNFNMSMASEEQINQLKLYDRDVWLINNFIKKIPNIFCNNLEKAVEEQKNKERIEKASQN